MDSSHPPPTAADDEVYDTNLLAKTSTPDFAPPSTPLRTSARETYTQRWRSPAKIGRAALSTHATPNLAEYHNLLRNESTSTAEKELASRVVKAAEKLREWCVEIERWGWSGASSFEAPSRKSWQSGLDAHHVAGDDAFEAQDYCGSLPRAQVEMYEGRLDRIDDELTALEVDELKEHVLNIHVARSRPSSSYSTQSFSTLNLMDEFSLFVTETLVQTLPYHAKLKQYLRAWSTRLAVLVKIPSFLRGLEAINKDMNKAYHMLQYPLGLAIPLPEIHGLERDLEELRDRLQDKIAEVGGLLDSMLDITEGSDDSLPDHYIDKFEKDEEEHRDWAVLATRKLFQMRMLAQSVAQQAVSTASEPPEMDSPENGTKGVENGAKGKGVGQNLSLDDSSTQSVHSKRSQPGADATSYHDDDKIANAEEIVKELDTGAVVSVGLPIPAAVEKSESEEGKIIVEDVLDWGDENAMGIKDTDAAGLLHPPATGISQAYEPTVKALSEDQVEATTANPRNSSSTIASQPLPISDVGNSSVPASPVEANERPISWATQPSSPPSVIKPTDWAEVPDLDSPAPHTPHRTHDRKASISSIVSSANSDVVRHGDLVDESPSLAAGVRQLAQAPRPPLNLAMKKKRGENTTTTDQPRIHSAPFPDMESLVTDISPPSSPTKFQKSPKSPSVPLEEQISTILESIPAPIRLRSGPSADAPDVKLRKTNRTASSQYPRSRAATPSLVPLPQITLAPADELTTRKASTNDPEIKVYHLSQPGKDKPIKLFVRRVGENGERVMVRVGGGWADLGEYLRGYAEHHGRRAVSDGRVEVVGLRNEAGVVTPGSRRASLVSGISSSGVAGTTFNNMDDTSSRSPTPAIPFTTETPRQREKANDDISTPLSATTPSQMAFGSAGSKRSVSGLWDSTPGDVSLAGPAAGKKGKGDMSEEKKLWVEGIVEQALQSVPGRKSNGVGVSGGPELGDLGKKGGTRRVFLRGGGVGGKGAE